MKRFMMFKNDEKDVLLLAVLPYNVELGILLR